MINKETLDRMMESQSSIEEDRRESIGVVLVVVATSLRRQDTNPLVWTVQERTTKDETEKIRGQISLPAETRKVGEQEMGTVLGALAEFTGSDDVLKDLYVDPEAFYAKSSIKVKGRDADVAILVYDGPTVGEFKPVDPIETRANGWLPIQAIQRLNGEVRPLAHESIAFAEKNGVFVSLVQHRENLVPLASFLQPDFSIKPYIAQRDQQADVSLA